MSADVNGNPIADAESNPTGPPPENDIPCDVLGFDHEWSQQDDEWAFCDVCGCAGKRLDA